MKAIKQEELSKDQLFCDFDDEKDYGETLIKEEIKEECLEDPCPLLKEKEENFVFEDENSLANSTPEGAIQNCLQGKIHYPNSIVLEFGLSHSDSQVLPPDKLKVERTRTTENSFKCNFCSHQTLRSWSIQTHERTHTAQKLENKGNLPTHERSHTDQIPFKCTSCPPQAGSMNNLLTRERNHTELCKCQRFKDIKEPTWLRNLNPVGQHTRVRSRII